MIIVEQVLRWVWPSFPLLLLHFITLRALCACLTSLLIALLLGRKTIRWLQKKSVGQMVRDDGPKSHLVKQGTPTMGGVLILLSIVLSVLLWADCSQLYILLLLFVLVSFGLIGWLDDYIKVMLGRSKGLSARHKMLGLSVSALFVLIIVFVHDTSGLATTLYLPFFKTFSIKMGWWFLLLGYFVIVGTSNAVNLTDGLDGLAIFPVVLISAALGVFAYVESHHVIAHYLVYPVIPGVREVVVFCAAMIGAGMGFLWFNAYPAEVFMGDVGALALGGLLGTIALLIRQEVLLFFMGGIFVVETISVALQVISFKLTGNRIFKMAPLHHHFELAGWHENKVVCRFWLITFVLVLLALLTLKIR